jgi:hypothetical protein
VAAVPRSKSQSHVPPFTQPSLVTDALLSPRYWRPGEEAPTGRMPRNIYREYRREYRRGHEAGFHPGRFEGFRGGLERGFQEGHPRGWEDAYGMGYAGMEYGRGYGDIFPHAESWGYHDTYGVFDEWDQGGYGGGYGGYNRRYSY